jgi:hypothetical protein
MGIELPRELADVAAQAGVRWPQADEDGMRQSAAAWREAGDAVHALARDSDGTARHALDAVQGAAGDAARRHWDGFVGPSGHLPTAARGCHAAADRLEHAAGQVGAAKVEIVRHLVTLAKNRDAAHQAAAAGHPAALAGLDAAVRGTAANVAHVHRALTHAVRQHGGVDVGTVAPLVHASPGAAPPPLLGNHHDGPLGLGTGPADGHGPFGHGDGSAPPPGYGPPGHGGAGGPIGYGPPGAAVAGAAGGLLGQAPGALGGMPGHQPVDPRHLDPDGTGPIPVGSAAGGPLAGGPGPAGSADAPELVHQSSAGSAEPPPAVAEQAGPAAGAPATGPGPAGPGTTGGAGGGFVGAAEPGPPGAVGAAPGIGPGGAGSARPGPATGGPGVGGPAAGGPSGGGPVGPVGPVGRPEPGGARAARSGGSTPEPPVGVDDRDRTVPRPAVAHPPVDRIGQPRAARAQDSGTPLALFVVHMFPIGHLPVPTTRPARQLRPPAPELDYAAGLRFPPQDHPESALVHDGPAMRRALAGQAPPDPTPARGADDPAVAALAEGHDPLGGEHERDWDRRFLVRPGGDGRRAEYAWPPAERYPEGGSDVGEPVVLREGTELDRFGSPEGRVLAPAGTPFRRRSLPPEYLAEGYRRYRVLRPLPVWRAVSAAWFGQPGGGERYRATYPVADLVALGWLVDVTDPDGVDPASTDVISAAVIAASDTAVEAAGSGEGASG